MIHISVADTAQYCLDMNTLVSRVLQQQQIHILEHSIFNEYAGFARNPSLACFPYRWRHRACSIIAIIGQL